MTAPHDKLDGIKPGDRVRVTFEGVVEGCGDAQVEIIPDGGALNHIKTFRGDALEAPTFQIERIEPPLSVNDAVKWSEGYASKMYGKIIALHDEWAWILMSQGGVGSVPLRDLERIA